MQHISIDEDIPLSWIRSASTRIVDRVDLHTRKVHWLALINLGREDTLEEVLGRYTRRYGERMLIRGCSERVRKTLSKHGFQSICIGKEAVLELNRNLLQKKSLRELVRRGNRHGRTVEIPYSDANRMRIGRLKKISRHGPEPQLQHLFRNHFTPGNRAFVFEDGNGNWLAAVTISQMNKNKMQTELLLRASSAPVGVMEALVVSVFEVLQKEGHAYWSLGEVPFTAASGGGRRTKQSLVNLAGRTLNFAYNYKGLFQFKNKFQPRWENVFICARPRVSLRMMAELLYQTNLVHLMWWKINRKLFNIRS